MSKAFLRSCDINSNNLLESKVIFEDGIEVAYENSSKTVHR